MKSPTVSPQPLAPLPLLDGIRAIAATWVLLTHTATAAVPIGGGALAVDAFILLSGFLMMHLSWRPGPGGTTPASWRWRLRFWWRRYCRLAPLYYVALGAYFLIWSDYVASEPPGMWQNGLWHLSFLFGFIDQAAGPSGVMDWSLSLEMQFYLVFPWLWLAMMRWGLWRSLAGMWIVTWLGNRAVGLYVGSPPGWLGITHLAPGILPLMLILFGLGMGIAWLRHQAVAPSPGQSSASWLGLGAVSLSAALCFPRAHAWIAVASVGAACAAYGWRQTRPIWSAVLQGLSRFFDRPFWRLCAELSYGVYVFHYILLSLISPRLEGLRAEWPLLHWAAGATLTLLFSAGITGALLALPALGRTLYRWAKARMAVWA